MANPKISVIIPAYNVEAYIVETLDSLLAQAFAPFEIVIINDGSTDGTLALLESKYSQQAEVKIFTQTNAGVGAARLAGFEKAKGDYLFFCDPDDLVGTELFEKFHIALQENAQMELFYFSKRSFVESAQGRDYLRRNTAPTREGWFAHGRELLEDLILAKKYNAATWQYIFKKKMTERFEVSFEGRAHEDHLFSMNVYLSSSLCYATQADLYHQRVRQGSLTQSRKDETYFLASYRAYRDTLTVLKGHLAGFPHKQAVALSYMDGYVAALIVSCVKHRVKLPEQLFSLTRIDARDCELGYRGGIALVVPQLFFFMKRLRFELRAVSRRLRGRVA